MIFFIILGMNELLWICMLICNFAMIMVFFRLWGKTGLYAWMPISCIIANIQVTKTVVLFGLEATLGNIVYATAFLATDILNEFYSKKSANKAVFIGLSSLVCSTALMSLSLIFEPSASDTVNPALSTIFSVMPRITLASLIAFFVSNIHDVWAFSFWKRLTENKYLWLRNNASTWVSQLIDSVLFTFIAFYGTLPLKTLWQIVLSTYVLKIVVAVFDTFMIYLARYWVKNNRISDLKVA